MRARDQTHVHLPLSLLLWQIYLKLSPFAFGALISQFITDIAKYSIGRLRPHFIDVCHPRLTDGTIFRRDNPDKCIENKLYLEYHTDFTCDNNLYLNYGLKDARLSFMSGHSSLSFFCLIYLAVSWS